MKWFKHLVFLVFFVIVFSFVEIHEKRREVLLEKNSKVSYVVAYPRILRTICLFLFGVGVILFLCKRTIASTCSYASFSAIIVSHDTESKKLST